MSEKRRKQVSKRRDKLKSEIYRKHRMRVNAGWGAMLAGAAPMPSGSCPMSRKKIRYADQETAERALVQAQRGRPVDDPFRERRAYLCPRCNGWHLTHLESEPQAGQ